METTIILYRAMCKEEMESVKKGGISVFRGYEGKLFATNLEDAARFGKANFLLDGKQNFIGKFIVPVSINHIIEGPYQPDFMTSYYVDEKNFYLFNTSLKFEEFMYSPAV